MNTKNNLLITTTNTIEGASILEYKGVITANIVLGVNFLKEFVASFSDFFGGTSGKYRKEMDRAYNIAMDILEDKAIAQRANAVVGVKVDYDEISGGGKSMLMVSISGTAIVAQFQDNGKTIISPNNITYETLMRLFNIEQFKTKLSNDNWMPKEQDWSLILKEDMVELIPILLPRYISATIIKSSPNYYEDETSITSQMVKNFHTLLDRLSYDDAVSIIYENFGNDAAIQKIYADLIITHNLFNADAVLSKLSIIDKHVAISLLRAGKSEYEKTDIDSMKKIVDFFSKLPDTGKIEDAKGGLFSKGGRVMVCEHGHKTSIEESEFCKCGINIKGIDSSEVKTIEDFKSLVNILDKTLFE